MTDAMAGRFVAAALANPLNGELLRRLAGLALPQCHLVAGSLFQSVWNAVSGRSPADGVKDYDIFYFDGTDLSWEAEDRVIRRTEAALADLGITFDLKNQARVHLWYEARFGRSYPQLRSARDGIDRFLVAGTCVGLAAVGDRDAALYAPFGLDDIFRGLLRPNPLIHEPPAFRAKAESYRTRWRHLVIDETPASYPPHCLPGGQSGMNF